MQSFTHEDWFKIADALDEGRITFSTGHQQRVAPALANFIFEVIAEEEADAFGVVALDFGDDWDGYMLVSQGAAEVGVV